MQFSTGIYLNIEGSQFLMKKTLVYLVVSFILLSIFATVAFGALTAEEIIKRRDNNEYFDTAKVEAEMVIINRNRRIVMPRVIMV